MEDKTEIEIDNFVRKLENNELICFRRTIAKELRSRGLGQIDDKLRLLISERDNYTCGYCGKEDLKYPDKHIDHIKPIGKGGDNKEDNLIVACKVCNHKKHSYTAKEWYYREKELGFPYLTKSKLSRGHYWNRLRGKNEVQNL